MFGSSFALSHPRTSQIISVSCQNHLSLLRSHPRTSQIIFERVQIWINTTSKTSTRSHRLRLRTIRHRLSHLDSDLLYFTHCQKNPPPFPRPLQQPSQHSKPSSTLYLSVDQQRWFTRFVSSDGWETIVRTQQISWKLSIGLIASIMNKKNPVEDEARKSFTRRNWRFSSTAMWGRRLVRRFGNRSMRQLVFVDQALQDLLSVDSNETHAPSCLISRWS